MSNEEEKITNENLKKIKPQSPCKRFKGKKLGKDEYWSPNLVMSKSLLKKNSKKVKKNKRWFFTYRK